MATLTQAAEHHAMKAFIAVVDGVLKAAADLSGADEKARHLALLACSLPYLRLQSEDGRAERPIAFLRKYLAGSGEDEMVDLAVLLCEDAGVRGSVHRQVLAVLAQQDFFDRTGIDLSRSGRLATARALGAHRDAQAYRRKLSAFQSRELTIDVPQSDFQKKDWMNATGGFSLSWQLHQVRSDSEAVFVRLWGSNLYRWHPEVPRRSQLVHRAAEAMKKYGAKDFLMVFKPCLMSVQTGQVMKA